MKIINEIKADYFAYRSSKASFFKCTSLFFVNSGFRAVVLYRLARSCRKRRIRLLAVFFEKLMHHLCHCWISSNAEIGEGFAIRHVGCIVIGSRVKIGFGCDIRQGVTIGGNAGKTDSFGNTQPLLGDNVLIGAGAKVLGPIVIGNNCTIGANAVVINSFDDFSVIGGVPAKLLKRTV